MPLCDLLLLCKVCQEILSFIWSGNNEHILKFRKEFLPLNLRLYMYMLVQWCWECGVLYFKNKGCTKCQCSVCNWPVFDSFTVVWPWKIMKNHEKNSPLKTRADFLFLLLFVFAYSVRAFTYFFPFRSPNTPLLMKRVTYKGGELTVWCWNVPENAAVINLYFTHCRIHSRAYICYFSHHI